MEASAGVPGGCVAWEGDPLLLTLLLSFLLYIIVLHSCCGIKDFGKRYQNCYFLVSAMEDSSIEGLCPVTCVQFLGPQPEFA